MKSTLQKTWALFTAKEKRKAITMLVLAILMAITETLGVLSIMPFLSVLGRPAIIEENLILQTLYTQFNFTSERYFIIALGIASITMVLASSAFKTAVQHLLNRFVQFQRFALSSRLLTIYLHQPYSFFLGRNSAELSKNVLSEVDGLVLNLIQPLSQLIAQGVIVVAMAGLIIAYDPLTAFVILFVIVALYGAIYGLVRKRLAFIGNEVVNANKERYKASNEAFGGIREIKISHSTDSYLNLYNTSARNFARHNATNLTLSQTPLYIVEAVGYSGLIILALALLVRSNDIAHVLPALGMYAFAAYRLLPAIQIMYRGFAQMRFSSAALDNIHRDLDLRVNNNDSDTQAVLAPQREIRLNNIQFAYPSESDKPVFDNYSISIPANSSTGVSGRSGAGKSTLMDLLLGLVEPQSGSLQIDDTLIDASNIRAWHNAIGYVPQHIYLTDSSIRANIAFGIADEAVDQQAIEKAAKAAQIHDFIVNELPQGYDTIIGERGVRLSGGQRQRIGIARALYKDPPVLFMDEATSALDNETELAVNEAIQKLSGEKTVVIIAHRKAAIERCEQIINLK